MRDIRSRMLFPATRAERMIAWFYYGSNCCKVPHHYNCRCDVRWWLKS